LPTTSPHPHAGLLLMDFLLDPDGGQPILASLDYGSQLRNPGFETWSATEGLTAAQYEQRYSGWEKLMQQTLQARR
jgi:hypothetical protein